RHHSTTSLVAHCAERVARQQRTYYARVEVDAAEADRRIRKLEIVLHVAAAGIDLPPPYGVVLEVELARRVQKCADLVPDHDGFVAVAWESEAMLARRKSACWGTVGNGIRSEHPQPSFRARGDRRAI